MARRLRKMTAARDHCPAIPSHPATYKIRFGKSSAFHRRQWPEPNSAVLVRLIEEQAAEGQLPAVPNHILGDQLLKLCCQTQYQGEAIVPQIRQRLQVVVRHRGHIAN